MFFRKELTLYKKIELILFIHDNIRLNGFFIFIFLICIIIILLSFIFISLFWLAAFVLPTHKMFYVIIKENCLSDHSYFSSISAHVVYYLLRNKNRDLFSGDAQHMVARNGRHASYKYKYSNKKAISWLCLFVFLWQVYMLPGILVTSLHPARHTCHITWHKTVNAVFWECILLSFQWKEM